MCVCVCVCVRACVCLAPDFILGRWVWSSELPAPKSNHVLSGGVFFAYLFFLLAHRLLTGGGSGAGGAAGGVAGAAGHRLGVGVLGGEHTIGAAAGGLHRRGQSLISTLHVYLRQILDGHESRQIFYYLCLNMVGSVGPLLGFAGVCWVLLGPCWVLLGLAGFVWTLLTLWGFAGFCWTLLDSAGVSWVLLGFSGLCWVLLSTAGFAGVCWTLILLGFAGRFRF